MPVIPGYSELFRIRSSCIIHGKDEVISSILIKGSNGNRGGCKLSRFCYMIYKIAYISCLSRIILVLLNFFGIFREITAISSFSDTVIFRKTNS